MTKIKLFFVILSVSVFLVNCKKSDAQEQAVSSGKDSTNSNKFYIEPGDVRIENDTSEVKFRPTLPLDQAAFSGSGENESRLKNEFEFMFDKTWKINGRVIAGDDNVHRKTNEIYNFNRDGSYTYSVEGVEAKGTWKGWMKEQVPIITVFPENLDEKVSEWNVKNTGKTMIWSGTTSYKDNAVMIQYVINK